MRRHTHERMRTHTRARAQSSPQKSEAGGPGGRALPPPEWQNYEATVLHLSAAFLGTMKLRPPTEELPCTSCAVYTQDPVLQALPPEFRLPPSASPPPPARSISNAPEGKTWWTERGRSGTDGVRKHCSDLQRRSAPLVRQDPRAEDARGSGQAWRPRGRAPAEEAVWIG